VLTVTTTTDHPSTRDSRVTITRVFVVDDHLTFAELLSFGLNDQPDLECVGHATNGRDALHMIEILKPDVVVMDYRLADIDGVTLTTLVLRSNTGTRVVMLTASSHPSLIAQAAAAGACAFIPKSADLVEVISAVRTAQPGNFWLNAELNDELIALCGGRGTLVPIPELTPREEKVLQLLAIGLDARRISTRLELSLHTVRGHIKNLFWKLDCHTQLQAVVIATRLGIVESPTAPPAPRGR
jgi:DNA-binding NarL/FixJ family response regulator